MQLVDRLKADLRSAMKARDNIRIATLRMIVSALDNATAVEVDTSYVPLVGLTPDVPRRELSDAQQRAILHQEADGRRNALRRYQELGKSDEAERMRAELAVLTPYLDEAVR
jgi:uncharacterized protein YqeY